MAWVAWIYSCNSNFSTISVNISNTTTNEIESTKNDIDYPIQ
jgi:hypothetical protein